MPRFTLPLAGLLSMAGLAAAPPVTLVVRASGFLDSSGQAVAKLFLPGDNVKAKGRWELSSPIRQGRAEFRFQYLNRGAYAVVVFHDQNANGVIDHNALRFPSEPLGFSNGFALGLLSGLPTFGKLRFELVADEQTLDITMK